MTRRSALALLGLLCFCFARAEEPLVDRMSAARTAYVNGQYHRAIPLLEPLAKDGQLEAQQMMGSIYQYGLGLPPNAEAAAGWFQKALRDGERRAAGAPGALASLAVLYQSGQGVPQDLAMAMRLLEAAAGHGFDRADDLLGSAYFNGTGVARDQKRAFAIWKQAAENGYAPAMASVSDCYRDGTVGPKNPGIAFEWVRKAAQLGHVGSESQLGSSYSDAIGVVRDDKAAVKWWRKAAENEDPFAQANLGWAYENGRGVDQDLSQSIAWTRLAAAQGNAYALYRLGHCYLYGIEVEQDEATALPLLRKAVEAGNDQAKGELAEYQMTGDDHLKLFSLTLGKPLPATIRPAGAAGADATMWIIQPDFMASLATGFDELIQKAGVKTLFVKPNPRYFDREMAAAFRQIVVRLKNNIVIGVEVTGNEKTFRYLKEKWGTHIPFTAVEDGSGGATVHWESTVLVIDGSVSGESDGETALASALVPSLGVFNATLSTRELIRIKAALDQANRDAASK